MASNQFDQEILELVNYERTSRGLDALEIDSQLDQAANLHTDEMVQADEMSHQLPGEAGLGDRVTATGYEWSYLNENIAAGQTTPEEVMYGEFGWMNSNEGHREAILNPEFTHIGIGYDSAPDDTPYDRGNTNGKDYDTYWTQVFATGEGSSDSNPVEPSQNNTENDDSDTELDSNTEADSDTEVDSNTEMDSDSDENPDSPANLETGDDSNNSPNSQSDSSPINNENDVFDRELLELVNYERTSRGLDTLEIDSQLDQAANLHTDEMIQADEMSHQLPGEAGLGDRVTATGYEWSYLNENIAAGQTTPEEVMYGEFGWMNSNEGHREAILNPEFTHIGIGYGSAPDDTPYSQGNTNGRDYDTYWTQVFATEL